QRFSYYTSKLLTQDSSKCSIVQLDPSSMYSSNEPIEYYEESNKHSFEENNIKFTSKTSSNSINSCDELSSDSLSILVKNEFFEDIANKALNLNKLSQNIDEFSPYFKNTTTALMFS
ncbi:12929_t:CDS:2, partial [Dentiscutata heterogama]